MPTWALFLLIIGTTFGFYIIDLWLFPLTDKRYDEFYLSLKKLTLLSASGLTYYWYWLLNQTLTELLINKGLKTNNRFKWFFLVFSLSLVVISFSNAIPLIQSNLIFLVVSPLILAGSYFYMLFNLAHKLRLLENSNTSLWKTLISYDPMLFAFFPIGIWFLQPRILSLLKENKTA